MSYLFMLVIALALGDGSLATVTQCYATSEAAEEASQALIGADDVIGTEYWEVPAGLCKNQEFSL